ncbi:cytoplasmic dynein 1 light intermediate chain 1-like [Engraulis encrasicolus]|uniref:cytoplasmic dynein 1 light intermediate chain 1-like n=1 Tax=Engraulis encrasicolus TaxID=184585 RepID=UPI002FD5026E
MAAVGRASTVAAPPGNYPSVEHQRAEEDDGQNLWSSILSEVTTRSGSKLPTGKNVLVLGETGAGKTTLMAKLQGVEDYMKGKGLEYMYFNVLDEDIDDHTRCNAWVLDGDLYHKGLQKFAVSQDNLADSMIVLVVDMSRPWLAVDSLQKWASVIREHIDKLRIVPETRREMEQTLIRHFQEYTEPGPAGTASPHRRAPPSSETDDDGVVLPLGDNTLTHNLGVPMMVVCTKCDAISTLEKEHDYRDEHFDFIQSHIRHFCLQYGAALLYTSVKEDKNLDLLYKYIIHRLYGFLFDVPAQVVEKDSVFIPSGWDNEKKIAILYENFQTLKINDNFEDIIVKPPLRKLVQEKDLGAEEDQVFLAKLQTLLTKNPPAAAGRPTDPSNRGASGSPRASNRSATANVNSVMPMHSGGQTSEGVLANFFNSLLSKKQGAGANENGNNSAGTTLKKSGSKSGLSDQQAELDGMGNQSDQDPSSPTSTNMTHMEAEDS